MPAADHPYVIGAIRHYERGLLGADEYTRLREAADVSGAIQALVETPYGQWLDPRGGLPAVDQALLERLVQLKAWLTDVIADPRLLTVITARYDGLNAAAALIAFRQDQEPGRLSPLSSISRDTLISALWHNVGWETVPAVWRPLLQRERADAAAAPTWKTDLIERLQHDVITVMHRQASTPLTRAITTMTADRIALESLLRRQQRFEHPAVSAPIAALPADASLSVLIAAAHEAGYRELTTEQLTGVREQQPASRYEHAWDLHRIARLRRYQSDPVGADPIAAFWFTVELEAKTIRLLLAAKAQGVTADELARLERPIIRHV